MKRERASILLRNNLMNFDLMSLNKKIKDIKLMQFAWFFFFFLTFKFPRCVNPLPQLGNAHMNGLTGQCIFSCVFKFPS